MLSFKNYDIQLRLAAVQAAPVWFDGDASVDKACGIICEAARNGADIIGFPELFISGYPWWLQVMDPLEAARFYKPTFESAMTLGDLRMRKLMATARECGVYVVMGYAELAGSSLYMSQVLMGADGGILANRRKLKPTHVERCVYGEGDGSDLRVVATPVGRIGMLNCWEHYQAPEIFTMECLHEQIHVASWPSHDVYQNHGYSYPDTIEANRGVTSVYAQLTQTFVISATTLIDEAGQDAWGLTDEQREFLPKGGGWASIFAPEGSELTREQRIPSDQEGVVYADVDLTDILQCKIYRDPTGQYSRPDIFTLHVNRNHNALLEEHGKPDTFEYETSIDAANAAFRKELETDDDASDSAVCESVLDK